MANYFFPTYTDVQEGAMRAPLIPRRVKIVTRVHDRSTAAKVFPVRRC